jgi:hypothetical protein
MNYHAALDVSLRSVLLCVMDEEGDIKAEGHQNCTDFMLAWLKTGFNGS